MASQRYRNFGTIVYPESMPDDFWTLLDDLHIPVAVSPLHDSDINPDTGELKKPHYHLLICMDGKYTIEAMKEMLSPLGCVGCENLRSKYSSSRYLCHLDNPEKHLYSVNDIRYFGGIVLDLSDKSAKSCGSIIGELSLAINDNSLRSPSELISFLVSENKYDLLQYVQDHAYFVRTFLL